MDVLYIGDIPSNFHYAQFSNYYVDLYEVENLQPNRTYNFYRVYLYDNYFAYDFRTRNTSSYFTSEVNQNINVSDNYFYRRDFPSIFLMFFGFMIIIFYMFNLITSMIRKGGLLGGLL